MNDIFTGISEVCTDLLKLSATISLLMVSWAFCKRLARPTGIFTRTANTITTPAPVKMPQVIAAPVQIEELVECGNCHSAIKSEPEGRVNGHSVYACETCGMRVQVPD